MLPRSVLFVALVLGIGVSSSYARGQQPGPEGDRADDAAPAEAPEKKAPSVPAAGYAYSDKPAASAKAIPRKRYRAHGPVVNMPGFEQNPDGTSRLFVRLSQSVPVEERRGRGSITYVLKGASPRVWNNTNALVTVHFNTPVSSARIVPRGKDLHFVVDLRADVLPTWKVTEAEDKSATITIDFPKGNFLPGEDVDTTPEANGSEGQPSARGQSANPSATGASGAPSPAAKP